MKIISKTKQFGGSYPPIQEWHGAKVPNGYYLWPDRIDTKEFQDYNGFVDLTISRDTVVGYTPNEAAWNTWKENMPEAPEETIVTNDTEILNIMLGVNE